MKNRESLVKILFLVVSVVLVVGIIIFINTFRMTNDKSALKVGAVLIGVSDDKGWNESHYKGIKSACDAQDCIMYTEELVPEEEEALNNAVSGLVEKGCKVIFLTSYGYGGYSQDIAVKYPDIAFYCISGNADADNFASYFARMYQARYLSGIVAGAMSKTDTLGYVTASPIPETVRSIDAYALGARLANPNAKVIVKYTGGWDDKDKEEAATKELSDLGADVITFHEDRPYAIDLADKMGLYTTGYDYVSGDYSDLFLTAAVFNWDMLYEIVLNDYLSGRANFSKDYWLGLSEGAVSLYPYSDLVPEEVRALVSSEEERIKTLRDVFTGEIYDNKGELKCHENEMISDNELFNEIDWYVEGVVIDE